MRCLTLQPSGALQVDPEGSTCAPEALVLLTQAEADQAFTSPFALTVEQGFELGGSILLLWATAWAFRAISSMLKERDDLRESD